MHRIAKLFASALLLFFSWVAPLAAGEYSDPNGFSFTYPDGWIAVANPGKDIDPKTAPPQFRQWLEKNNISLSRMNVVLIRDGQDEFPVALSVLVNQQQIPVNDDTTKQLLDMMRAQAPSMGATIADAEGHVRKVGANEAIVYDFQTRLPGVPVPLKQ